jgi:hypothetical protein
MLDSEVYSANTMLGVNPLDIKPILFYFLALIEKINENKNDCLYSENEFYTDILSRLSKASRATFIAPFLSNMAR